MRHGNAVRRVLTIVLAAMVGSLFVPAGAHLLLTDPGKGNQIPGGWALVVFGLLSLAISTWNIWQVLKNALNTRKEF